jgi:hypothetical protein
MSRLFGPMRQVGIVVRDIEKAMRHWVEVCGVGPWFYAEQLPMDEFRYKGRIYDLKVSIALANSGDVQLELIQQRNDVPSLYSDFLAAGTAMRLMAAQAVARLAYRLDAPKVFLALCTTAAALIGLGYLPAQGAWLLIAVGVLH